MSLNRSKIKGLCFDVDGTLRDTDDHYVQVFMKLIGPFSGLLSKGGTEKLARWLVMRVESPANFIFGLPDRMGLDDELVLFSDWLHRKGVLKTKEKKYLVIKGVAETLAALGAEFPMSVVTARPKRGTQQFLARTGINAAIPHIAHGQTTPRTKPFADPVLWAAKKMGVAPDECLMIGDTTVDIKAGVRAGAQTVGVLSGFGEEMELVAAGADIILNSVADLPRILL
jgi:HAD superfamily hydrolase (TIGR01549 family)